MNQLSSITPLEIILIGFAAVGIFLFFRACWRNIKRSRQHLGLSLLTLMMSLTAMAQQSMTSSATSWSGEYTVTGTVTIDSEVRLTGDATVNLAEGATLNINGRINCSDGTNHALTINGSGTMNVTGSYDGGGIIRLFSKATINGGTVNVTNSSDFYGYAFDSTGENCIVVLNGGTVHTIVPKQNSGHFFCTNFTLAGGTLWPEGGIMICNMKSTIADGYVYEDKATEKLYAGTLTSNEKKEILGHEFARNPDAYTVKVVDVDGVTVTADCRAAKVGDIITVTAQPTVAGYFIGVKYNYDTDHELSLNDDGQDTFEMPAANVTISATKTAAFAEGDGTKDNPFLIKDKNDWSDFRKLINSKLTYEVNKDKCFKLDDDISVTSRIGANSTYVFMGTFDGGGHTLNVSYNAIVEYIAPFRFVNGATIKNLHVNGTITTERQYIAGIVGRVVKGSVTTIENCRSSVTIQSSVEGDGTHGGFVAYVNSGAKLTINGCVFDGKIVSTGASATTKCGGFVGWKSDTGSLTIKNSLYAPQTDANAVITGATFARNGGTITNCYYTQTLGTAQGKQAYEVSSAPDLLGSSTGDGIVKTYGTYGLGFDNKYYLGTIPLSETEGVSYLTDNLQGETVPVVFKRTFKAGQPSTLCLPFSFVPDQTTQGKVYEFGGVNDQWRVQMNNIQRSDATAATVANQPYGFIPVIPDGKKAGDEVVVIFRGTASGATVAADHTQVGNWDMHGTYERVDWSSGYWYGYNAANGVFSHCISGAYFPAYRCYLVFTPPSATRGNLSLGTTLPDQMGVDFNDSANALATGVSSITVQTAQDAWYTLDGRKLDAEPTKKGIYIYKGKKVIK